MIYTIALVPFIVILTYESIYNTHWQTRRYSRVTLGCILAASVAFWI